MTKHRNMADDMASQPHRREGGGRRGRISEELQLQAKQKVSPVVNQLLVSARKGFTEEVKRLLEEGGHSDATLTDKVNGVNYTSSTAKTPMVIL